MTAAVASLLLSACNQGNDNGFEQADNGLKYKFHKKNSQQERPARGDVVIISMTYETADGDVLFTTSGMERTYMQTVKSPTHTGGSFEEALAMMHVGDSATFKINAHDFLKFSMQQENLPENIDPESDIRVHVKLQNILKKDDFGNQIVENLHVSEEKEMELLENYLELTNTTSKADSSGLYVISLTEGTGKMPEPGDEVTVHYTGTYISGEPFDSSLGKQPFTFIIGEGSVIKGWELGLQQIKEGGKARLIIPSKLAYGKNGKGDILPYSTLIFEIELIDVSK